jgi:hypothetical protein
MATVSTEGLIAALNYYNANRVAPWQMCLYHTSHVLIAADVLATYDALETTYPGYARQALLAAAGAVNDGFGNAFAAFGVYTFTTTGVSAETVYGMYIRDVALGVLIGAVQFTSPVDMTGSGNQCIVTLSDTMLPA